MVQPANKRLLTEASAGQHAADSTTPLGAALSATYVRFEDEAGNPLPTHNVVIKVSATTGEIVDIVSEA